MLEFVIVYIALNIASLLICYICYLFVVGMVFLCCPSVRNVLFSLIS